MTPAIRVENLAKCYRVGLDQTSAGYRTLRETVTDLATAPFRRWRDKGMDRTEPFWALNDVNFEVQPGEVVGLIGRNGAGKSTLLKILSRITKPSRGRVELHGRVGSLLEVGTGFHPELTGRDNVYLNGSILGMSRREIAARFDEIVDFAEIGKFLDTPVKRYSSGMYVRLAFAVAAHLEPEILIVDEVLAVGDAAFQKRCLNRMSEVAKSGRTVFFVSHTMTAVKQLCTRAIHFAAGRLVNDGAVDQTIENYLSDAIRSTDGRFDLTSHPARLPKHSPLIRSLTFQDEKGEPTTTFLPWEPFVAVIGIEPEAVIREPRIALAVEDTVGRRIWTAATYFQKDTFGEINGPVQVRCQIPRLRLAEGRYLVSVSIGTKYSGLLDSLDAVACFDVGWNNSYGNGEMYGPVYGPVLQESTWESTR